MAAIVQLARFAEQGQGFQQFGDAVLVHAGEAFGGGSDAEAFPPRTGGLDSYRPQFTPQMYAYPSRTALKRSFVSREAAAAIASLHVPREAAREVPPFPGARRTGFFRTVLTGHFADHSITNTLFVILRAA